MDVSNGAISVLYIAGIRGRKTVAALMHSPDYVVDYVEFSGREAPFKRMSIYGQVLGRLLGTERPYLVVWDVFGIYPVLLSWMAGQRGILNAVRLRGDLWTEIRQELATQPPFRRRLRMAVTRWAAAQMIRRSDLLLPVSPFLAERAMAEIGIEAGRCRAIPTVVDLDRFRALRPDEQLQAKSMLERANTQIILTITNFNYWPKVEPLLEFAEVFRLLRADRPDLLWVLGGDGKYRQRFQTELARRLDNPRQIEFVGWLKQPEKWLQACDLFLYYTGLDTLSNVVVEAAASGKVCVVNRHPAVAGIITDQMTGYLVDPAACEQVAGLIRSLLDSPASRRPVEEAAAAHIRQTYSAAAIAARFAEVIHDLESKRRSAA
jgi:glycosyltransferase involved in cell wall biosynthesis